MKPLIVVGVMLFYALGMIAGMRTWYSGRRTLFVIGFLFPPAWWVGAFLPPTEGAPDRS
jgi:hypothetical protein